MLNIIVECRGITLRLQELRDRERKLQAEIAAEEHALRIRLIQLEYDRERELGMRP